MKTKNVLTTLATPIFVRGVTFTDTPNTTKKTVREGKLFVMLEKLIQSGVLSKTPCIMYTFNEGCLH